MTQEIPKDSIERNDLIKIDPLVPSRAAFYSAVIPGLGQIYTKKYWKLPLIYGAIGSSIYGFNYNNKEMKRYRVAYKKRIAGYTDDEFFGRIPRESQLIEGYKYHRKYRDLSALFLLGFYLLNILDANITTLIASIILFIFGSGPVAKSKPSSATRVALEKS